MKRIIILIIINIVLLGIAMQVTNENAELKEVDFEIGKTYVDKKNVDNKIVLFGDYSAEVVECSLNNCETLYGTFSIENNKLEIVTDSKIMDFRIKDNNVFKNENHIYVLE